MRRKPVLALVCALSLLVAALPAPAGALAAAPAQLSLSWWGGQSRHQAMLNAIDAYQSMHPGIRLQTDYGQFSPYYQKLIAQLRSDSTADLFAIDYKWSNQFLRSPSDFINLAPLLDELGFTDAQRAFAAVYGGEDGFQIGIPMGINAHCFAYNADFFARFGLAESDFDGWDALLEAGAAVHAQDPQSYLLFLTSDTFSYLIHTLVKQRTGQCLLTDAGAPGCTPQELADALGYIVSLLDTHTIPPFAHCVLYENLSASVNPLWLEGRVGIFPSWTSGNATFNAKNFGFDVGYMRYPCPDDALNSGALVTPTLFFAVSAHTSHQEEAFDLLKHLFTGTQPGGMLQNAFGMPLCILSGEEIPEGVSHSAVKIIRETIRSGGLAENAPSLNSEVNALLKEAIHAVGYGTRTPEEAADAFLRGVADLPAATLGVADAAAAP